MLIKTHLLDHSPARIIATLQTVTRLSTTCFRGRNMRCAGNFSRWQSLELMVRDGDILPYIRADILESTDVMFARKSKTFSVTISCDDVVGWSATDTMNKPHYNEWAVERFSPNQRSTALRVKSNRPDLFAPRTQDVTIVYELTFKEGDGWIAVIWSAYPGCDIGELRGDVSEREKRVFFDWNHPGA